jgi:phosphoribosylformylglycinamidine (FGAM) synthase-like enzyme
MWEFRECVDGIAEACSALEIPVTGGNVSFYNDTLGQSIYPTPILGVLGLLEDVSRAVGIAFQNEGDAILLLDGTDEPAPAIGSAEQRELSSSEYAFALQGIAAGAPPKVDLAAEKHLIEALLALAGEKLLRSAHDISDGGLAVTLAECCFASRGLCAQAALATSEPPEAALFGERGARVVISCAQGSLARIRDIARQYKVGITELGRVMRDGDFSIALNGKTAINAPCDKLRAAWADSLKSVMAG